MNLQIGSYKFTHICSLQPETEADGTVRAFMPQTEYRNSSLIPLHAYGQGPFCKFVIPKNLRKNGVYALSIQGDIKYIGECVNFSSRYNAGYGQISPRNCYNGGQPTNCRVNASIFQSTQSGVLVDLWFYETAEYKRVESDLLTSLEAAKQFPPWNHKKGSISNRRDQYN